MPEFKLATKTNQLYEIRTRLRSADVVGFDTESSGPPLVGKGKSRLNVYQSTLTGVSIGFPDEVVYYVPIGHKFKGANVRRRDDLGYLFDELVKVRSVWAHNWNHDLKALDRCPMWMHTPTEWPPPPWMKCSMLMMWLLNMPSESGGYRLDQLAQTYLAAKKAMPFKQLMAMNLADTIDEIRPRNVLEYACTDALLTLKLGQRFGQKLIERNMSDVQGSLGKD